jgi:histidinol-phosphate aminotransferase
MIYLDRNENNYGPAPACFEILKKADRSLLSLYDRSFTRGTRGILSERLARDFGVGEDRVLLGYGAEHLLKQTVQCYLGRGKKLMVPSASWWYYRKIASEVEGLTVEFPMRAGEDRFVYDLQVMRDVYSRERPDLVFISSPNNPTGNSIDISDLEAILSDFRESVVVLDEAYVSGTETGYVRALIDANPNVLVVRTMSKYYALAGLRIGFGLMGAGLGALAKFGTRYLGYNRLSEEVAIAALDSPGYYGEIAGKMNEDRERYYAALGKLSGIRVYRSDANFVLAAISPSHRAGLKAHLEGRGLIIKFMDEPLLSSHIRITVGTQEENLALIDAIRSYYG